VSREPQGSGILLCRLNEIIQLALVGENAVMYGDRRKGKLGRQSPDMEQLIEFLTRAPSDLVFGTGSKT
tara:strand:- start:22 stop:228 length:207 start_codon:yes stop_codon:yes gene_type:complete